MKKVFIFLIIMIFFVSFGFNSTRISLENAKSATIELYNFVTNAGEATWISSSGSLPYPGTVKDMNGCAKVLSETTLENGNKYSNVLLTMPQWKSAGWIKGTYPSITIPEKATLTFKYGLESIASKSDGVTYRVYFKYLSGKKIMKLFEAVKTFNRKVETATIDLSDYKNYTGVIYIEVSANRSYDADYACWFDFKINYEKVQRPDLIITDLRIADGIVYYKIKNIGDLATGSLVRALIVTNTLYINNRSAVEDSFSTAINPGAEIEKFFKDYKYSQSGKNTLKVCADTKNVVTEHNEQNNCYEEIVESSPGGIKVLTSCSLARISIYTEAGVLVKSGLTDGRGVYSTDLTLQPGSYKVVPTKDRCTFTPPVRIVDVVEGQMTGATFECNCTKGSDLVITEIVNLTAGDSIHYIIKNKGDEKTDSSFYNSLEVDGKVIATDFIEAVIMPGEEYNSKFSDYIYRPSAPSDKIRICADYRENITESAENNNCYEVEKYFPDLTISRIECDFTSKQIKFTVSNIGRETTTRSFNVALYIEDELKDVRTISVSIEASSSHNETFQYTLECYDMKVKVIADSNNSIFESDDNNNSLEKECNCGIIDNTPPKIIAGPDVVKVNQTSALISWETNEDCDHIVYFDSRYKSFSRNNSYSSIKTFVKIHDIEIMDLKPGTLYGYYVESKDRAGNPVRSKPKFFKTKEEVDNIPPTVSYSLPETVKDTLYISPNITDNKGIKKVILSIDKEKIAVDYSTPYNFRINTKNYDNGKHTINIIAYDLSGNNGNKLIDTTFDNHLPVEGANPTVLITYPTNGTEIAKNTASFTVTANIGHTYKYDIDRVEVYIDNELKHTARGRLRKGAGMLRWESAPWATGDNLPKTFTYNCNISSLNPGTHFIKVKAVDENEVSIYNQNQFITVLPDWIRPSLFVDYSTEITPSTGNYIHVNFRVVNNGSFPAKNITVEITQNTSPGFIIVKPSITGTFDFSNTLQHTATFQKNIINDKSRGNIEWKFSFDLCPVISSNVNWNTYSMITNVRLKYDWDGKPTAPQWENFDISRSAGSETQWLTANADYLIVTNPGLLRSNNAGALNQVNNLIMAMGELAVEKQGVVGYLSGNITSNGARSFIHSMGNYLNHGSWKDNGYLLIVGETEIVPSFDKTVSSTAVQTTDYPYASTSGTEMVPELCIGRIIGDTAERLCRPIIASLDVKKGIAEFKRGSSPGSDAYLLSGTGGGEDSFWGNVVENAEIIKKEFYNVAYGRGKWIVEGGNSPYDSIKDRASFTDVLFYRDHCGDTCWCNGVTVMTQNNVVNLNFNKVRPFIFPCCCQAGRYRGIYGIAEAFLQYGASTYIGATENSGRGTNNTYSKYFFNRWINNLSKSLGQAWKETRIQAKDDAFWSAEYQFYGDPKFGKQP